MAGDTPSLYRQLRERITVAPLSEILSKLLLLAKDVGHKELEQWVQLELRGYLKTNRAMTDETIVPEYRGVTGRWHNDQGQPLVIRDPELSHTINVYRLRNGAAELEEMSRANSVHSALDQTFPPIIRQHLQVDVTHFQFYSREVAGVLSEIRARAIEWLSEIKQHIPNDAASIESPPVGEVASADASVFYSWQSDLPNSTNRGFIEDCLEKAIKELKAEGVLRVEPCLDRDTMNVPGSPDIAATIFDKIESTALFVCDVSIINKGSGGRLTPNPNVLVELGYGVKTLGWERVVCIFNSATGRVEDLPFDLRQRRIRVYSLDEKQEKAEARRRLTSALKADLQAAFSFTDSAAAEPGGGAQSALLPKVEVLASSIECQPPIRAPGQPNVQHVRPQYEQGRLVWTTSATLFVDSRPGAVFSVALHRCKAWMNDRYSGKLIPLANLAVRSDASAQVTVDDAVLLIRGPGRFSLQGSCETPFRDAGYPDVVNIEVELPVTELGDKPIRVTLALHEVRQDGGWPLRWKHASGAP